MHTHRLFWALVFVALSPIAQAQAVKVSVVAVESLEDLKRWLGTPVNPERAASPDTFPGNLKVIPVGRKTQLPILVSGLPSPAQIGRELVADVEILGTDGRSLGRSPKCCKATIARGSETGAALLDSAVIVEPESSRSKGSYTVKVTVTDGWETWTASQVLPYGDEAPFPANDALRLRMNVPPNQAEPGSAGDKRDCLSLPTPAEVIKCSEAKK